MFFHEYVLTPQVFSKEYCNTDISLQKDLINLLRIWQRNGLIADLNNSRWHSEVLKHLMMLSPGVKDKFMHLFQQLSKHNRLVKHESIVKEAIKDEQDWIDLALLEDKILPYSAIVHTGKVNRSNTKLMHVDELAENELLYQQQHSVVIRHSYENIAQYLKTFLAYARKLTIIDPYFTYNQNDSDALLLYAKLYAARRGSRLSNRKIIIHTRYSDNPWLDMNGASYRIKWVELFKKIHKEYGHIVTLNVWKDDSRIKQMHDRHMITDQGGVHSGRGFGIMDAESTWSLLDNETARCSLNNFLPNVNSGLELVYTLSNMTKIPSEHYKKGIITKLLHDNSQGKDGFILSNRQNYYFNVPLTLGITQKLGVGTHVRFIEIVTEKGLRAKDITLDGVAELK